LCLGLASFSADQFRALDGMFGGLDSSPRLWRDRGPACGGTGWSLAPLGTEEDAGPGVVEDGALAIQPTLALVGWSPVTLRAEPSPLLRRAAARLTAMRRYLGLALAGVVVWQPPPQVMDNLQFRLSLRDAAVVRELLLDSADALEDFERFVAEPQPPCPSPGQPNMTLTEGRAELLAQLAADHGRGQLAHSLREAQARYSELVERDLIRPLRDWARASDHPVIQSAGEELASVCAMLHEMSPFVQELLRQQTTMALEAGAELSLAGPLPQYLQLMNRQGALMRDLQRMRKWL